MDKLYSEFLAIYLKLVRAYKLRSQDVSNKEILIIMEEMREILKTYK